MFQVKRSTKEKGSAMNQLVNRVIELAVRIQQISAPTFEEKTRASYVFDLFVNEGLVDVSMDEAGNAYGRLKAGTENAKPLIVSAHLDTVFPASTDLTVTRELGRIYGPG